MLEDPVDLPVGGELAISFTAVYRSEGEQTEVVRATGVAVGGDLVQQQASGGVAVRPVPKVEERVKPQEPIEVPDRIVIEQPIRMELVRIPAGEFLMGSDKTKDRQAFLDEQPQHSVRVDEFYVGRVPVTVAQFEVFVKATGYETTAEKQGYGYVWTSSRWEEVKGADWRHPRGPGSDVSDKSHHPVTQISWHDAVAFCRWLSEATGRD